MMKTTEPAASSLSFALCQHRNKPGPCFRPPFLDLRVLWLLARRTREQPGLG
jgi:hypothetical protein